MKENSLGTYDFKHLEKLFDASNEGLWTMRADRIVRFFNKNFYEKFNLNIEDSPIEEWIALIHPDDRVAFSNNVDEQTENGIQNFTSEYRVKHKKGHYIWIEAKGVATFDADGHFEYMVGSHTEITERKRTEAKMYKLAYYDRLTGLLNRSALLEALETEDAIQMLYFNLARFRLINDTFGYERANDVLKLFADTLALYFSSIGNIYRVDADEFAVILPKTVENAVLKNQIKHLKKHFKEELMKISSGLDITLNIGRSLSGAFKGGPLIEQAKWAMLYGKKMGFDHCIDFSTDIQHHTQRSYFMETSMTKGLISHEFFMTFQPVMATNNAQIGFFECLMRWQNQKYGFISPDEFIPVSERTRDIISLGKFAIERAFEMIAEIKTKKGVLIPIAINISAIQLFEADFYHFVLERMAHYELSGNHIIFEITETVALEVTSRTLEVIKRFKALGILFALDDFGSGFSSLTTLLTVPFDYIKIDKKIMKKMVIDDEIKAFISALVYLCHVKGLSVVGEGVEDLGMLEGVREIGMDYVQGYYYARPFDASRVIPYIDSIYKK